MKDIDDFESELTQRLMDGAFANNFIYHNAKLFGFSEEKLQEKLENYLGNFTDFPDDDWFYEVCATCGKAKLVRDDMDSTLENPAFVCNKCGKLIEYQRTQFGKVGIESNIKIKVGNIVKTNQKFNDFFDKSFEGKLLQIIHSNDNTSCKILCGSKIMVLTLDFLELS